MARYLFEIRKRVEVVAESLAAAEDLVHVDYPGIADSDVSLLETDEPRDSEAGDAFSDEDLGWRR